MYVGREVSDQVFLREVDTYHGHELHVVQQLQDTEDSEPTEDVVMLNLAEVKAMLPLLQAWVERVEYQEAVKT